MMIPGFTFPASTATKVYSSRGGTWIFDAFTETLPVYCKDCVQLCATKCLFTHKAKYQFGSTAAEAAAIILCVFLLALHPLRLELSSSKRLCAWISLVWSSFILDSGSPPCAARSCCSLLIPSLITPTHKPNIFETLAKFLYLLDIDFVSLFFPQQGFFYWPRNVQKMILWSFCWLIIHPFILSFNQNALSDFFSGGGLGSGNVAVNKNSLIFKVVLARMALQSSDNSCRREGPPGFLSPLCTASSPQGRTSKVIQDI